MLTNVLYALFEKEKTSPPYLYIQSPISIVLQRQQVVAKERFLG